MSTLRLTSLPLTASREAIRNCCRCLPADEFSRAARLATPHLFSRFVLAHAALRILLGKCLNIEPRAIEFDTGPYGKPRLSASHNAGPLQFNLSHSEDQALIGIADVELGVDIESVRPDVDIDALATAVLTEVEREQLEWHVTEARRELFYRFWVAKEACIKQTGEGINRNPQAIEVFLSNGRYFAVGDDRRWYITELAIQRGYRACFATLEPASDFEVNRFDEALFWGR